MPSLQVYFPEGSLQFEIVTNPKESQQQQQQLLQSADAPAEVARRGHHPPAAASSSSSFQEARRKLLRVAAQRIETQRKHHQLLRSENSVSVCRAVYIAAVLESSMYTKQLLRKAVYKVYMLSSFLTDLSKHLN